MPYRTPLIDVRGAERNRARLHKARIRDVEHRDRNSERSRRPRERRAAKEAQAAR
jgi:hypothetical protein